MKLLFRFSIGAAILAIIVALYFTLIITVRPDKHENNGDNNEVNGDMFLKKQICPKCKTGKYTYDLDPKSETCPHIGCWKRNRCHFYKPLDKTFKKGFPLD